MVGSIHNSVQAVSLLEVSPSLPAKTPTVLSAARLLFVLLAAFCLSGCIAADEDAIQAAERLKQQAAERDQEGSQESASESAEVAPVVDPEALNENGEIVLDAPANSAPADNSQTDSTPAVDSSKLDLSPALGDTAPRDDAAVENKPAEGTASEETVSDGEPAKLTPQLASGNNRLPSDADGTKSVELPEAANVATYDQKNQKIAPDWPQPQAVIFVSGQQHGYIEPCGCTGLENQKGGLIRRDTLLTQLRDRGWELVPVDVGNQVRRSGRQPTLKFQSTVNAFKMMDYKAVTLGVDDVLLNDVDLIQIAGTDGPNVLPFISANVVIYDEMFFPAYKIVEAGGRKIGITGVLGAEYESKIQGLDIVFHDPVERLKPVVKDLKGKGCDYVVLLAHASLEESAAIAKQVDGFDLVVTAGGFGEPTLNPEKIDGTDAVMVQVGTKGMWGGIVGLFDDPVTPIRYQKIAISSQFEDSDRMLVEFANYQEKLKDAGFEELEAVEVSHASGHKFVGSEVCGDCHTTAYDIWENSPHVHATDSIVAANNDRGGIARHFDPECVSCHVTGWEPQRFYPFESGFASLEKTEKLVGSGCENCHGPGSAHVAAEMGDIDVSNDRLIELQQQMVLKLEDARENCMRCHDLDNSPDFNFEEYWDQVKHYGKD